MDDGKFSAELISGVSVVSVPEEIDVTNALQLGSALLEAAGDGSGTLVADMSRTRFCDSAGIHTLVAAHKHARAGGGELLLVTRSARILRVLAITGIDRVIPHFANLEDALAHKPPGGSGVV